MLSKKNRIDRKGFVLFAKSGRLVRGRLLSVRCVSSPTPKWSVVVSKKTARSSVERHRIKRRVYAALEEIMKEKKYAVPSGICYPLFSCLYAPFHEIKKEIETLLHTERNTG